MDDKGRTSAAGFDKYLLSEYEHIAEAHFKTIDTITVFFRYYLLIMSIPTSIIAVLITIWPGTTALANTIRYVPVLAAICLVIFCAGFGVMLYLINLRMDAVLYARTVNAIRKHFYDKVPKDIMDVGAKLRERVLPQTASQPSYLEIRYFGPVVGTIAVFNTFYLFWASALFGGLTPDSISLEAIPWFAWLVSVVSLISHYIVYSRLARYREHAYLRSHILGVDICGVLNEHRAQFCKVLRKHTRKIINPDDITVIPVHEHPTLNITREDEKRVFNDPEYWTNMNPTYLSVDNLRRIRTAFNLRVILFTHRPWPNTVGMEPKEERQTLIHWKTVASQFSRQARRNRSFSGVRHFVTWARMKIGIPHIERITRMWLEKYGFVYDKLIVEKASDDVSDPQARFVNRFYIARKKGMKFFVEDDLEKAIKLAYICDIVFLFDQPYNRNQDRREPLGNIIRVESWDEVYRQIRRLS